MDISEMLERDEWVQERIDCETPRLFARLCQRIEEDVSEINEKLEPVGQPDGPKVDRFEARLIGEGSFRVFDKESGRFFIIAPDDYEPNKIKITVKNPTHKEIILQPSWDTERGQGYLTLEEAKDNTGNQGQDIGTFPIANLWKISQYFLEPLIGDWWGRPKPDQP